MTYMYMYMAPISYFHFLIRRLHSYGLINCGHFCFAALLLWGLLGRSCHPAPHPLEVCFSSSHMPSTKHDIPDIFGEDECAEEINSLSGYYCIIVNINNMLVVGPSIHSPLARNRIK